MSRLTAAFIVLIGAAGYGVLGTLVKWAYEAGFHVGELTGSQMFVGALTLWVIALVKVRSLKSLNWKTVLLLMAVGSFTGLTGIFYYSSLQVYPASIAIILLFQFTWVGVLYEWLLDRRKPTKQTYLSLVLVWVGTVLAAGLTGSGQVTFNWFGLVTGLASAFTYAAYIYVSGRVAANITPWLRSALMISGACLAVWLIFPPTFFISGALGEGLWLFAPVMAFFGAILPAICFTVGVPHIGSGLATIISSVELPVAVLMAWLALSERVTPWQWLGVVLILIAIVLGEKSWGKVRKKSLSSI